MFLEINYICSYKYNISRLKSQKIVIMKIFLYKKVLSNLEIALRSYLKPIIAVLLILLNISLYSQKKNDTSSVYIPYDNIEGQDATKGYANNNTKNLFWGSTFDYAVFEFTNILKSNLRDKKEQKIEQQRLEKAKQQSLAKLAIIKTQYTEYSKFPEIIIDGWHMVIVTDNLNFCKEAKVLVKNNRVIKFVIDNYIPMNFMATRDIKNGKNVITLKNFNSEQFNILELYFLYDLDRPQLVAEPIKPGYVSFWTDVKKCDEIEIRLNDILLDRITVSHKSKPECFSNGTVSRILKPGTYYVVARGGGKGYVWRGTIDVKENMCLQYYFKKSNSD